MTEPILLQGVEAGVGVLTLNRPAARNALNSELMAALAAGMAAMEADDGVDAVVLTGTDPAFCAGLDLKELATTGANLKGAPGTGRGFWAPVSKPVIGAVNGPAITGGLELALQCDFLVASERAVFGDTHARVGVVPGGGLSVLLPQAIGVRRAKELSLTGRFLTADQALAWGLVNHVVPHDQLLAFTLELAASIAAADRWPARAILDGYRRTSLTTVEEGWRMETEAFVAFRRSRFDPATVARFTESSR